MKRTTALLLCAVIILSSCLLASCKCRDREHDYKSSVTVAASCTKEGERTYTCSKCGDTYTETIEKLQTHNYQSEITKDPTCAQEGEKTLTCSICGNVITESIPKEEHTFEEKVTKEAACTSDGILLKTCTVCGETEEETINAPGHQWIDATCTTPLTCSVCCVQKM